jgi:GTP-binding protein
MRIKTAEFVTSARSLAECPDWGFPEFAFIGRSNVGKSSLINLLAGRHDLAKVSATPGKTRLLNFFLINKQWSLVDLPGYGYAKTPQGERFDFQERAGDYLEQRHHLRRAFVLIDSRHKPQRIDLEFTAWLGSANVPFSLIFTKTDKQSAGKTRESVALFLETIAPRLPGGPPAVLACSAKSREGRLEILRAIAAELKD